jgi:uncharacterized protein (TIGR03083 family)
MTTDIDTISRIDTREEAERLGFAAYAALIDDLEGLTAEQWETATVCAPWTIADMARHLVGAAKANASTRELMRQLVHGARHKSVFDGNALDATNQLQVDDHRHLGPADLLAELRAVYPDSVRTRTGRSRLYNRLHVPIDAGGSTADGMPAKLNLGDLFRVVYTRDVWLHRIDIAKALGRQPALDAQIDGRIVEDVVKEWADRHSQPFDLHLTGPAGGHFRRPGDGPTIELDAVEFCWILSGRAEPAPDLNGSALLAHRLLF